MFCLNLSAAPDTADFLAVVQYVKGNPSWVKRPQRKLNEAIEFKSFIHPSEVIELSGQDYIKIINNKRCVGAAYAPGFLSSGTMMSPADTSKPVWSFKNLGVRWICDKNVNEVIELDGLKLSLTGAEIFYYKRELYVRKGRVVDHRGRRLPRGRSYVFDENKWNTEKGKYEQNELWEFNEKLPAPKESARRRKPFLNPQYRFLVGPTMSFGELYHDNDNLEFDGLSSEGARISFNHNFLRRYSLIASVSTIDFSSDSDRVPVNVDNRSSQMEAIMFELGWRLKHYRNHSYFARVGLGELVYDVRTQFFNESNFLSREEKYNVIALSAGADRIFFSDWLEHYGLFASAELYFLTSFAHTGTKQYSNESLATPNSGDLGLVDGDFWFIGVMVSLGGLLQF